MTFFAKTLAGLSTRKRPAAARRATSATDLAELTGFGSNPGALSAKIHVPASLQQKAALVVVLHGCTQTASGYDAGSGWSRLADEQGFAVLFPEQNRGNNANLCFNWFETHDIARGGGEVLSIRQMVDAMIRQHGLDDRRVFVTGLSAGGAMAGAMLAAYPDVFAGGAIIAGLPYATAGSVPEALERMRGGNMPDTASLQARLREAVDHSGPWPTISVWHGTDDKTVVPANALAIIEQWRGVHGVDADPSHQEAIGRHIRQVWPDADGNVLIECYSISGMGHGTPIDQASGYGKRAPFMIDIGLSSTELIARSWQLTASFGLERPSPAVKTAPRTELAATRGRKGAKRASGESQQVPLVGNVQKIIEDALRSAGLMK
ncbi:poly(hydroxyalkanoate) depolymerase family esterase [Hoeflea marina]|uniref:Poly(Hydroxyalkanoate) depolymerase family esterase n=1 Tax=Hoeflea marina TaxID=274592 RepID=A0A317PKS4_9HYPH|nr:PHB depolymerase family esterase [Hoeflea marina]PWW00275.1 poly(hydroxyalkanoate) depolymerase family esterase [Hoeflea marina]